MGLPVRVGAEVTQSTRKAAARSHHLPTPKWAHGLIAGEPGPVSEKAPHSKARLSIRVV
jgi:hypothetical protein